jgi:hypothetical protein
MGYALYIVIIANYGKGDRDKGREEFFSRGDLEFPGMIEENTC